MVVGWTAAGWAVMGRAVIGCGAGPAPILVPSSIVAGPEELAKSVALPSWVCWVQLDPSHQRSKPGTPNGSGYQPEGGLSMPQG